MTGLTGFVRAFLLCAVVACGSSKPSTAGPACDTLVTCCGLGPGSVQASCIASAEQSTEAQCATSLSQLQENGVCPASTVDAGHAACDALSFCCPQLTNPDDLQCAQIAQAGDETECTRSLTLDSCSGDAGGRGFDDATAAVYFPDAGRPFSAQCITYAVNYCQCFGASDPIDCEQNNEYECTTLNAQCLAAIECVAQATCATIHECPSCNVDAG